jgi:hypothetical protein
VHGASIGGELGGAGGWPELMREWGAAQAALSAEGVGALPPSALPRPGWGELWVAQRPAEPKQWRWDPPTFLLFIQTWVLIMINTSRGTLMVWPG